ncbi:MAG TPA: hypothetical protein VFW68_01465 [Rhodocyclaceae bacterium]|nr:hypothetical protein [Rhodocyclaceae bacterium]
MGQNITEVSEHELQGISGQILKLAEGTTLDHFNIDVSDDGQCLLVYCADDLVAIHSAMGSDVEEFHFPDGARYSLIELIRRIGRFARAEAESDDP